MAQIYEQRNTGNRIVIDPCLTMGDKICTIDMKTCGHKFLSPGTLKRNYTLYKEVECVVEVRAFTGMPIGMFPACRNRHGDYTVVTKTFSVLSFDHKTGKQYNAKTQRYANQLGWIV